MFICYIEPSSWNVITSILVLTVHGLCVRLYRLWSKLLVEEAAECVHCLCETYLRSWRLDVSCSSTYCIKLKLIGVQYLFYFGRLKSSEKKCKLLGAIISSWSHSILNEQSMLVEAIEQLRLNSQVAGTCLKTLTEAAERTKSSLSYSQVHALVLVNHQLVSLYSTYVSYYRDQFNFGGWIFIFNIFKFYAAVLHPNYNHAIFCSFPSLVKL